MSYQQYIKYCDALKYQKKILDETIEKHKKISTKYQNYLKDNPYKEDYLNGLRKIEKLRNKIIDLAGKNPLDNDIKI